MKQLYYKYAGLFFIVGALAGCMKEPTYPVEPQIEFKNIENQYVLDEFSGNGAKTNLIKITCSYKDGDGDLGLSEEDIDKNPKDTINFFIETFIEHNEEFILVDNNVGNVTNGHFLRLAPEDKKLTLEGDLSYSFRNPGVFLMFPDFKSGDHLKFRVQIKDRAGNFSNKVETDPVPIFFE